MRTWRLAVTAVVLVIVAVVGGAEPALAQRIALSDTTRAYVSVEAPVVALTHVIVIDGTGAAPRSD